FSLLYGFYGSRTNFLGAILSTIVGIVSALYCYLLFKQEEFVFVLLREFQFYEQQYYVVVALD
ncbi:hypothetical protein IBF22_07910, partial [Francisella tularensis]|nr:hypothetical protein [Francisella tularensis]